MAAQINIVLIEYGRRHDRARFADVIYGRGFAEVEIGLPVELDFMAVSSYGEATESSGVVRIVKDLETDIRDRDVLLVEDIVDSGLTLRYLRRLLLDRGPRSLEVCALLVREGARTDDVRYVGFPIPPDFVVGYGLDVAQHYRELDSIRVFEPA